MDMPQMIESAAARTAAVVSGVRAEHLVAPTPCSGWDVRALLAHMTGFLTMSERAARKAPAGAGAGDLDVTADTGWRNSYREQADKLAAAWADRGAWQGMTAFGPREFPAELAGAVTLLELTVHGWDLARATGQELPVDDEVAGTVRQVVTEIGPGARAGGSFAEPVPVEGGAATFSQALAASGRDPGWTPAAARA